MDAMAEEASPELLAKVRTLFSELAPSQSSKPNDELQRAQAGERKAQRALKKAIDAKIRAEDAITNATRKVTECAEALVLAENRHQAAIRALREAKDMPLAASSNTPMANTPAFFAVDLVQLTSAEGPLQINCGNLFDLEGLGELAPEDQEALQANKNKFLADAQRVAMATFGGAADIIKKQKEAFAQLREAATKKRKRASSAAPSSPPAVAEAADTAPQTTTQTTAAASSATNDNDRADTQEAARRAKKLLDDSLEAARAKHSGTKTSE